jgi:hypothetical protein
MVIFMQWDKAFPFQLANNVTCIESHVSEIAFPGQQIGNFLGYWHAEAHIHGNAQAAETELLEVHMSIAAPPHWQLLPLVRETMKLEFKFRRTREVKSFSSRRVQNKEY